MKTSFRKIINFIPSGIYCLIIVFGLFGYLFFNIYLVATLTFKPVLLVIVF